MTELTVLVGGAPALAAALRASGRFARVDHISSTLELRELISSRRIPMVAGEVLFLFADTLTCDTPPPLDTLVQGLTSRSHAVIILDVGGNGLGITQVHRQAGVIQGPFTLNNVLGAIGGHPGLGRFEPLDAEGAYESFDIVTGPAPDMRAAPLLTEPSLPSDNWAETPTPVTPLAPIAPIAPLAPAAPSSPLTTPLAPVAPSAPPAAEPGWSRPEPTVEPAAQMPAAQMPAPQMPAPQMATPPGAMGQSAPYEAPRPSLNSAVAGRSLSALAGGQAPAPEFAPQTPGNVPSPVSPGQDEPVSASGWQTAFQVQEDESFAPTAAAPVPRGGPLTQHAPARKRLGRVITVSAPKGGTGKTSLSLNLAAYLGMQLRAEGKTVCIVDSNFGQADIGTLVSEYNPNIFDLAKDPTYISVDRIAQKMLHKPEINLSLLLGPSSAREASPTYITPDLYNRVLDVLVQLYDYVINDTQVAEAHSSMHNEYSLARADRLIVPVNPNIPTLFNADSWLRDICSPKHGGGIGFDENKVGIVLNMAIDGIDCDVEDVARNLGAWSLIGVIPYTPLWQLAINRGELVATYNYEELNQAFASVLYSVTGEEALLRAIPRDSGAADSSLKAKLTGLLKKRSRA
jgi:septum formation inhibitor-activating ATPase MinD